MRKESVHSIGTIISTEDSPSTGTFSFVLESTRTSAKKGQFVQVETQEGIVFGYVNELIRANRYFERAESVAEYEKVNAMGDHFPVSNWDYLVGEVKILGTARGEVFGRTHVPPHPGAKVAIASDSLLRTFLGFHEGGLHIGSIQHHALEARIDLTRLVQKHFAILAMSGAGKSYLTSIIIEELLERTREHGRIAVIVIDIHGEYAGFQFDDRYGAKTKTVEGKDILFPLRKISPELIEEWMPSLSVPQRELLRHTMHELRKGESTYGFKELIAHINQSDVSRDEVKRSLKRSLAELRRYRFITKGKENPRLIKDVKPGNLLILDFSSIDSLKKKQVIVSLLARKLFSLRKKGKIPPFLLLIEEAHNFAREKAESSEAVSRSIIETIAREGRKFGASLCLISQRPVNLSTTALSQCSTHVILRVTNPNDLDHIQMSSEGIDARVVKSITSLKVGEALLVGEAVNFPIFVNVRSRKSTKREKGLPLHEQARLFEENEEKKEAQVEAFL